MAREEGSLNKRQDPRRDEDVHERDFEEIEPPEFHQLVITEPRQGPSNPDEDEEQDGDFGEEDGDVHNPPDPARDGVKEARSDSIGAIGDERQMPATEEEHDDQ